MPGINDSKWAPKGAYSTSTPAPASSRQSGGTDKHISVPAFGYKPPGAPASNTHPPRTFAKPPDAPSNLAAPPRSIPRAFERAEAAGKAAAKRMDELQGDVNKWNKPFLYQNYGYPPPTSDTPARPTAAPSSPPPTASATRPTAETTEQKRARLHKLFNTWVPRAVEFYDIYDTLDLTVEEVKAIQDEIVKYRVKSAQAAGKGTPYQAEWETTPMDLPPQRRGEGSAADDEEDDPLGLGLPRAIAEGRRAREVNNLLD
ncbi:hypothetical protein E8E11_006752 [Didymella keratinophila]|nr:hypothetical protein E8E11_006752 [Didymella keratinophila]